MDIIFTGFNTPDLAATMLRMAMGVFFSISGFYKLFNKQRHAVVESTMVIDRVPEPIAASWFIPLCEFAGGVVLIFGFMTPLACMGLFIICCGAAIMDGLRRITGWNPLSRADYVDDVLYLPEVLYAFILITLILIGGGSFSTDSLIMSGELNWFDGFLLISTIIGIVGILATTDTSKISK